MSPGVSLVIRTAFASLTIAAPWARSQLPQRNVSVAGMAYDSLRGEPLRGGFVTVSGVSQSTTSDSLGSFHFTLSPGSYTIVILHPAFDSIGLLGTSTKVLIRDGRDTIRLFLPSFASLWRLACGPSGPPRDSGLVFGNVRRAEDQQPITRATVVATWDDIGYDKLKGVTKRRWHSTVLSDSTGGFALCGMPPDEPIRLSARKGSATAGTIDVQPNAHRVQRRDLFVAADVGSAVSRGVVIGVVRDDDAQPVAGARVTTDGAAEVRTASDGSFVIDNVPIGTREIEVLFVGRQPAAAIVDVLPRDSARVDVTLQKVTVLPMVNVIAQTVRRRRLDEINERRESGMGQYMDSTVIERYGMFQSAISSMADLRFVVAMYIDGVKQDDVRSTLRLTTSATIGIVEEHSCSDVVLPLQFRPPNCRPPGRVILVWTKFYLP